MTPEHRKALRVRILIVTFALLVLIPVAVLLFLDRLTPPLAAAAAGLLVGLGVQAYGIARVST